MLVWVLCIYWLVTIYVYYAIIESLGGKKTGLTNCIFETRFLSCKLGEIIPYIIYDCNYIQIPKTVFVLVARCGKMLTWFFWWRVVCCVLYEAHIYIYMRRGRIRCCVCAINEDLYKWVVVRSTPLVCTLPFQSIIIVFAFAFSETYKFSKTENSTLLGRNKGILRWRLL